MANVNMVAIVKLGRMLELRFGVMVRTILLLGPDHVFIIDLQVLFLDKNVYQSDLPVVFMVLLILWFNLFVRNMEGHLKSILFLSFFSLPAIFCFLSIQISNL